MIRSDFAIGDVVKMTEQVARTFNKAPTRRRDWTTRVGVVRRISANGTIGVLWEGNRSIDFWPPRALEKGGLSVR